jgi:hypothetical protein
VEPISCPTVTFEKGRMMDGMAFRAITAALLMSKMANKGKLIVIILNGME